MKTTKKKKVLKVKDNIQHLVEENEEIQLIKEISRLRKTNLPSQPTFIPNQNNYYRF